MRQFFFLFLIWIFAASCTRTVYTPVTRTVERTDTLWRTLALRDSIHTVDSVIIYLNGDTLHIREKSVQYRTREIRDTIRERAVERDTVPVMVEVQKPVTRWQRTKQDWGGWAMGLFLLLLGGIIFVGARKRK